MKTDQLAVESSKFPEIRGNRTCFQSQAGQPILEAGYDPRCLQAQLIIIMVIYYDLIHIYCNCFPELVKPG
jgi:hypothetical protein